MYSKWTTKEELEKKLVQIKNGDKIEKSGIAMMYDDESIYVDTDESHVLVIGSNGSGKTQSILLPEARLAIRAGESIIINDIKGEISEILSKDLEDNNYQVIKLNFKNPKISNKFNILKFPYDLYKNGEKDKAIDVLDQTLRYLIMDEKRNQNSDPFWENTATNYFTGIVLYLFENNNKIPTLKDAYKLAMEFEKEDIEKIDKLSPIYVNLAPTVLAPPETKGSILSVLGQKLRLIISREQLVEILNDTDFNLEDLNNKKTALFIISENTNNISSILLPMLINQIYLTINYQGKSERRINILIDEFERMLPIKNFEIITDNSRSLNIKFFIFIKSFLELNNKYGKDGAVTIKLSFGTKVYLLANDMETLEEISDLCGKIKDKNELKPLISKEELKLLDNFEAIILKMRMFPIKTKILPDYQYPWSK